MSKWQYEYTKLIEYLDQYSVSQQQQYQHAWIYTKHMVEAHAQFLRSGDMPLEESLAVSWSQFESTFDENDDALLSLAGIVVHLVNSVPLGQTLAFHQAVEVGFLLARGFNERDAVQQHKNAMGQSQSAYPDLQITAAQTKPTLRVFDGGLSD